MSAGEKLHSSKKYKADLFKTIVIRERDEAQPCCNKRWILKHWGYPIQKYWKVLGNIVQCGLVTCVRCTFENARSYVGCIEETVCAFAFKVNST